MKNVGIGTRVLNFLIDTALIFLINYATYRVWSFYMVYWGYPYINPLLWFACTLFVYYIFFETAWARTPGKRLTYTRVADKKGLKPNFIQIFVRTIARLTIIDCFFIPFLNKTLHDYVSSTEVVEV